MGIEAQVILVGNNRPKIFINGVNESDSDELIRETLMFQVEQCSRCICNVVMENTDRELREVLIHQRRDLLLMLELIDGVKHQSVLTATDTSTMVINDYVLNIDQVNSLRTALSYYKQYKVRDRAQSQKVLEMITALYPVTV